MVRALADRAQGALADEKLRASVRNATGIMVDGRVRALAGLQNGVEVVETDLGEFIIQLAGETPSHIIAPAIHKNRYDVAELFTDDAERAVPADIGLEAAYARERLREAFLSADVGITGVNFAVAE